MKKKQYYFLVGVFLFGLTLMLIDRVSVCLYFKAHSSNLLPPAGHFIEGKKPFRFALLGDSGFRNEPFEKVLRDISINKHDFIINLGDQVNRRTQPQFEWLLKELEQEKLEVPYYSIPGNHELTKDGHSDQLRYYKRAFGQPYYWFTYDDVLFVCLNTSEEHIDSQQKVWIKNTLDRLREEFKSCFLLMHIPPIDPRPIGDRSMRKDHKFLEDIIKNYDITAMFAGHVHVYSESTFGGVPLYITPSSGQVIRDKKASKFGYITCVIGEDHSLNVELKQVDSGKSREYLEFYLSDFQDRPFFETGFCCVLFSGLFMLVKRRKKRSVTT